MTGGRMQRSGFTLIELLVAMAIAAVLAVGVGPSFRALMLNQRLAVAAQGLVGALGMARMEAIQRSQPVRVSALADRDWSGGWSVQVGSEEAPETLRSFDRLPHGISVDAGLGDGFAQGLFYDGSGFSHRVGSTGFGAGCLTLKAQTGRRVSILVSASGRVRVCNPDVRGDCGAGACGKGGA